MPLFTIDEGSGIPIWVQIRNRLAFLIESGYYKPGEALPTVRYLAADLGVNYHTCNKAYTTLEYDGYIYSRQGKGSFVKEPPSGGTWNRPPTDAIMDECIRRCMELGMQPEEIGERFVALLETIHHDSE
ncbi:MAG: GntR family transcriptional regulator [Eggerthellaceae bacterium]|nr:GntR family transcriptional regulator [Eggerthellaceae bacterium]